MNLLRLAGVLLVGLLGVLSATASADGRQFGQLGFTIKTEDGGTARYQVLSFSGGSSALCTGIANPMAGPQALQVLAGEYELEVWAEGYRPTRIYGVSVLPDRLTSREIVLRPGSKLEEKGESTSTPQLLRTGSLEGLATDGEGPAKRISLRGTRQGPGQGTGYRQFKFSSGESSLSLRIGSTLKDGPFGFDAAFESHMNGHYKIRDLEPGKYDIEVTGEQGQRPLRVRSVEIRPGSRTILDVTFKRGSEVEDVVRPAVRFRTAVRSAP